MKTDLLYYANGELDELARLGAEHRAMVDEMRDGGTLIDCGNLLDTELGMLDKPQRLARMKRIGQEGWLRISEPPSNLVFVFKEFSGKEVDCLLHAVDWGHGWRLRLICCGREGYYVFCPIEGHLDYECRGLSVGEWTLGGDVGKASRAHELWLLDVALTGFVRMRRPMTPLQARNRMLKLIPERSSAWSKQANTNAGTD